MNSNQYNLLIGCISIRVTYAILTQYQAMKIQTSVLNDSVKMFSIKTRAVKIMGTGWQKGVRHANMLTNDKEHISQQMHVQELDTNVQISCLHV